MSTPPTASILLVEDDLRLAELVSRYLQNNGFRVSAVGAATTGVGSAATDPVRTGAGDGAGGVVPTTAGGPATRAVCRNRAASAAGSVSSITTRSP